jgi:hypothetical protein
VTIANQDRQIRQLIERIQVLSRDNCVLEIDRDSHRDAGESLMGKIDQMELADARHQGWKDCAREILCNLMVAPVASDK